MAAHQAPLSLGFSRQEHWSGLLFPSPMHESETWKWSRSVMPNSLWPHGLLSDTECAGGLILGFPVFGTVSNKCLRQIFVISAWTKMIKHNKHSFISPPFQTHMSKDSSLIISTPHFKFFPCSTVYVVCLLSPLHPSFLFTFPLFPSLQPQRSWSPLSLWMNECYNL